MTVSEAYRLAVQRLGQQDDEARVKARLLVDRAAGVRYAHLTHPEKVLEPSAAAWLRSSVEKVAAGYPVAYALGTCEFFGLPFHCDERALIPRFETELLVEAALKRLSPLPAAVVADLGTGTGCIAISIAHALDSTTVYASDASPEALELARENADRLGVTDRIQLVPGTIGQWAAPLQFALGQSGHLDAILSNPPYIAIEEIAILQPEIRDWEPRLALEAGSDGLVCYREIAAQCGRLLKPGGFLMVELGAGQFDAVGTIFGDLGWMVEEPLLDLAGIERVLAATLKSQ